VLVVLIVVRASLLFPLRRDDGGAACSPEHTDTQTRTFAAAPTSWSSPAGTRRSASSASDRSRRALTTKEKRSRGAAAHVDLRGDAGGLELRDQLRDIPVVDDPCHVSMHVDVPRNTSVRMVTGTGDLRAEHLAGGADVSSGTGDLHVLGVRGPVRAHADTGDVEVVAPAPDISCGPPPATSRSWPTIPRRSTPRPPPVTSSWSFRTSPTPWTRSPTSATTRCSSTGRCLAAERSRPTRTPGTSSCPPRPVS
jgi:hypothetical protein